MNDTDAFLAEIREDPNSDVPRLVFADWLDEHGENDRAEFIRVQCERSRREADDNRRGHLVQQEADLLQKHGLKWAEHLKPFAWNIAYERGFVEYAEYASRSGNNACAEIVALAKSEVIRHLRDNDQLAKLEAWVEALPHLGHLASLEFWNLQFFEDQFLRELLTSSCLANLNRLILYTVRGGPSPDDVLIEGVLSPHRSNLTELIVKLGYDGPGNEVIQAMARSPYLAKLTRLSLAKTSMDLTTARAFVESPYLTGLTILDLGDCDCDERVWDTILEAPNLKHLRWLNISCSTVRGGDNWSRLKPAFDKRFGSDVVEWNHVWTKVDLWDPPENPLAVFWTGIKWPD